MSLARRLGRALGLTACVLWTAAAPASARAAPADSVSGAFDLPERPVWAGEVFDLTLGWRVHWDTFGNLEGELEWKSEPLVAEPWKAPSLAGGPGGAGTFATIQRRTRAMALQPGALRLTPARQMMVLQTGVVRMEDYERAITATVPVKSAPGVLNVRALPPPPPDFVGAVGRFTLRSAVDVTQLRVGEAVTWTVTMAGVGNWPALSGLPVRQASRDFDVVGAPKLIEGKEATLFERSLSEAVVLVPRRAGRYVLGGVEMAVFDPQQGRYVQVRAPALTLEIRPGPNGEGAETAAAPESGTTEASEEILPALLSGRGRASAPPPELPWRWALAACPAVILGLWMGLALLRARERDPDREARAAYRRLGPGLAALAAARDSGERRARVRSWQRDAAWLLKLNQAAPVVHAFAERGDWARLWAEAELFLYGRSGVLPGDWSERARRVLDAHPSPPPFRPASALRRDALLPALCLLLVCAWGSVPQATAAQGLAGQGAAVEGASERSLRAVLDRDPLDWRTRYNLAVTLAAQDRWDEAAGHAAVAWVQRPATRETRAFWVRADKQAGYGAGTSTGVPSPLGWRGRAVGLASPAAWRLILLASAGLAALAAALALLARYGRASRALLRPGLALLLAAGVSGAAACAALAAYGPLASPDAVLVWRAAPLRPLPVDALDDPNAQLLAAGAAGWAEGRFLDWRRVHLSDGRSGWMRQEHLIWVWGARPRGSNSSPG